MESRQVLAAWWAGWTSSMGVGSLIEEGASGAEIGCSCEMEGVSDMVGALATSLTRAGDGRRKKCGTGELRLRIMEVADATCRT